MSPLIAAVQVKRDVAIVTLATPDGPIEHAADGGDARAPECVLLPVDVVVLRGVREGVELADGVWTEVVAEGQRLLAVRRALEALSRRHRTERELRAYLSGEHGRRPRRWPAFPATAVDHAVERMRALGYLDDAAWAARYVASSRSALRGRALLRHELRAHVPDESAEPALAAHDDEAAAVDAARQRARSLRNLDEAKRTRRLYDFLRRRGFTDTVARRAMASVGARPASQAVPGEDLAGEA